MEGTKHLRDIVGTSGWELKDKRIALCITGSTAAYKCVDLARELMRHGAEIYPVMTKDSIRFIHPNLMEWATGNRPVTSLSGKTEHIWLAGDWEGQADLVLVAPCTANTAAKLAVGIDDTSVSTVLSCALGSGIPIVLVPAMHEPMYRNPAVVDALSKLKQMGVTVVDPVFEEGKAKIASVESIVKEVIRELSPKDMQGMSVLVTAGPTIEHIDPVRIISNRSTGKMGVALAMESLRRGAEVALVHGPIQVGAIRGVERFEVESTRELLDEVLNRVGSKKVDLVLAAAAPADYSPEETSPVKISSKDVSSFSVRLKATPKIIEEARRISPSTKIVAFKAEYGLDPSKVVENGIRFLEGSGADMVVVNDVSRSDVGFASDANEVYLVRKGHGLIHLPLSSKHNIARRILDIVLEGVMR